MFGSLKVAIALMPLIWVQNTGRMPPVADGLEEATRALMAQRGIGISMSLNGCMKDDRYSTAVTCYYMLTKNMTVEVHANAPKSRVERLSIELPGGKENVKTITGTAAFIADLLVPNVSFSELDAFNRKIIDGFASPFGGGTAKIGPYTFDYRATIKKTTLEVFN